MALDIANFFAKTSHWHLIFAIECSCLISRSCLHVVIDILPLPPFALVLRADHDFSRHTGVLNLALGCVSDAIARIHCTHTIQRFRTSTIVSHLVFLCKRDRARLVLVCLSGGFKHEFSSLLEHKCCEPLTAPNNAVVILESRRNWCLGIVLHDCHACILATTVPLPNA